MHLTTGYLAMQEQNPIQLFKKLHTSLNDFIKDYRRDHSSLLRVETQSLNKLEIICQDLKAFYEQDPREEKFTWDKYASFFTRILAVSPSETIVNKKESAGFLGIGASKTEETVKVALYGAIDSFVNQRTITEADWQKRFEAKSPVKEKNSLKTLEETLTNKFSAQFIGFNTRINNLEEQTKTAYQEGFEKGKEEGRQAMIVYMKQRIGQYLDPSQQQQILLLLEGKVPETSANAFQTVFAKPLDEPRVTDEEHDKEKAEKWIGTAKFPVVKAFTEKLKSNQLSEAEKIVAKWVIFKLMKNKYAATISAVLTDIQVKLKSTLSELKNLTPLFEKYANAQDVTNTKNLSSEELTAFQQLVGENALYLVKDGTASNYFGSHALQSLELLRDKKLTTEEKYDENVFQKLGISLTTPIANLI
jgi:hypothetical protein